MQIENLEDVYPLSPMQKGILFDAIYAPQSGAYFEQLLCQLHGAINANAMEQAWQRVADRYPILRTAFLWDGLDEPLQVVRRRISLSWERLDWRHLSARELKERLKAYLEDDRRRGFDLSIAPLMRLTVIRMGDELYQLIWSHHHLLIDGWSSRILMKETFLYYQAFCRNQDPILKSSRPYRDYIAWLQRQDMAQAEAFWRRTLAGFTAPTQLPTCMGAGGPDRHKGCGEQRMSLSKETTSALRSFARSHRLTVNTLAQAAWALLLSQYSGNEDVLFGVTVSGRPVELAGVESMVGLFINTLPLRTRARTEEQVLPWLKRLQEHQLEIRQYEYCPLTQIQGWSETPRGLPLFESVLDFDNYPAHSLTEGRAGGLEIRATETLERSTQPLLLSVSPGSELSFQILYDQQRFDARSIRRALERLKDILEKIGTRCHDSISSLSCGSERERAELIAGFNVKLEN